MPDDLQARALEIHDRLAAAYGEPQGGEHHRDPVSVLVSTILSQNTNDTNRDRAYQRLRERFPSWEAVRDAEVNKVEAAIRVAGLSNQKAPAIIGALKQITAEQGELSLDFLQDLPLDEAKAWLTGIKGVGPKTAAIVLLFALDRPAFPVDTHVHRVTGRLGLIGPRVNRERAHEVLEALLPAAIYYPFHLNLIRHGRQVCVARSPRCRECVLTDLCDYYARERSGQAEAS